jgi:hypothetical protein
MTKPVCSIICAYFERPQQFENTLQSIEYHYADMLDQVQLVVIDDSSRNVLSAERVLREYKVQYKVKAVDRRSRQFRNPGVLYNMAAEIADSELLLLTNPENIHCGNLITPALKVHKKNQYTVFGCRTLRTVPSSFNTFNRDIDAWTNWGEVDGWYQHSHIYNRLLHFASFITKDDYTKIGGFDPVYDNGLGYEDNDFIEVVIREGMNIWVVDDPFVAHQPHSRAMNKMGFETNHKIFIDRWGYEPRTFNGN